MSVLDDVRALVAPVVEGISLQLYDVEYNGGILRVLVDGDEGVDIGTIQDLSRRISKLLDEADPISGRYTLEVSSPGLERKLRTVEQFTGALGEQVSVKLMPGTEEPRRRRGALVEVGDGRITLVENDERVTVLLDSISSARTVFEWGPADKSAKKGKQGSSAQRSASTANVDREAATS